jgi:hypothetical protein
MYVVFEGLFELAPMARCFLCSYLYVESSSGPNPSKGWNPVRLYGSFTYETFILVLENAYQSY